MCSKLPRKSSSLLSSYSIMISKSLGRWLVSSAPYEMRTSFDHVVLRQVNLCELSDLFDIRKLLFGRGHCRRLSGSFGANCYFLRLNRARITIDHPVSPAGAKNTQRQPHYNFFRRLISVYPAYKTENKNNQPGRQHETEEKDR
jgi:hypothetical protein